MKHLFLNAKWQAGLVIAGVAAGVAVVSCSSSEFGGGARERNPKLPGVEEPKQKLGCNPLPLPEVTLTPTKLFSFVPTGENSEYKEFISTPVVGRLRKSDSAPSIVAVGFKKSWIAREGTPATCHYWLEDPGRLYAVNGKTGSLNWVGRSANGVPLVFDAAISPAIGDIDGDGNMEVFAMEQKSEKIIALRSNGEFMWRSNDSAGSRVTIQGNSWIHGISLADLNNDGVAELVTPGLVLDPKTGATKFQLQRGQHVYPADTNRQGSLELVLSTGVLDANGMQICSFSKRLYNVGIAKLKKDDNFLTVVGTSGEESDANTLLAYRGDDCRVVFDVRLGDKAGGPPNIADFDGKDDQGLEIGIAGKERYAVFDNSGRLLWSRQTRDANSGVTGSTSFDFNGDGKAEIVYNDEAILRVFDGPTGKVLYELINATATAVEYPVIVDVDGNGTANIVAVSNDCTGGAVTSGINVFREPKDQWMRTRPIWNQYGFNPLGVNDDGSVVGINKASIAQGAFLYEHLAGFRNNISYPPSGEQCK